jgi:hypothetical protein
VIARRFGWVASLGLATSAAFGQQPTGLPPIRDLGSCIAISDDTLVQVSGIRALSDGRVLVNDIGAHRVILFDSALRHPMVVADSTPSTQRAYGAGRGGAGLLPYVGDTTLLIDATALSLIVLDPKGRMVRTIAPPRPADIVSLLTTGAFDGHGHLVYPLSGFSVPVLNGPGGAPPTDLPPKAPARPVATGNIPPQDSSAILRANIAAHVIDTAGFLMQMIATLPRQERADDGTITNVMTFYPFLVSDDWAVVSDGSIAFVRASDYHVDWITPAGTRSSSPKIAHEWHRLSDSAKQWLVDSTRRFADSLSARNAARPARAGAPGSPHVTKTVYSVPDISEIPDYLPPFALGTVRADADDNLWIREGSAIRPAIGVPQVYDIVNRQGKLVDRIRLPLSLSLIGFGPGAVYLTSREGAGTVIVKYRIR